ncbi:MAG TPA: site-specific DNA-methyltransferase [Opitutaceae bacterium]|nr:site-specific DNA-methyltransferase [Opitutaceae bacterium]
MAEMIASGEVVFSADGTRLTKKTYLADQAGLAPSTLWADIEETGHNRNAKYELKKLFPKSDTSELFRTPKPPKFLEKILQIATDPGDLVLDSFAGSGTTGHAVLKMNAAQPDKPPRRFILVEMEPKIAREVTAERVRRVAQGYTNAKDEAVPGLGGGFRFCELGEPLYDEAGHIRPEVKFADLARHVYFSETGEPLPRERVHTTPLLGVHRGRAVCLLYNGILRDKSPEGGNALTHASLAILREACAGHSAERIVVYGTSCRLSAARRQREGIEFKQIPYQLQTP